MGSTLFTHAFALGTTANARQARGTRLAAQLHVEAAEADLSTAAKAVSIVVGTAVQAAQSAAENDVLLVDSVVSRSFSHGCLKRKVFVFVVKKKSVLVCVWCQENLCSSLKKHPSQRIFAKILHC